MLALILVSIASSLSSFWQVGIAHNERRSSALSVFSRIARDLRYAALPADPSAANYQLVINPEKVGASYLFPQAAFWQAPVASDRKMALVGYFVQWVEDTDGTVPKLCRLLVDSNYQVERPSDFVTDDLIKTNAPATKVRGYAGQLAENVLGLWMQPRDQKKNPIRNGGNPGQFDSSKGYSVALTNAAGKEVTKVFARALPASLEVALVAVDARTAKRLSGAERPGAPTGDMWADVNAFYNSLPTGIQQGARIYSTIIDLHNAPR